ncbi:hypothetical protein MBLNU459_g4192t2 [Dothideomycetes sp. NU459]
MLLAMQIGISCLAPVALAVVVTLTSFVNSNFAIPLQQRWLASVQERVAYTAGVLGCPKGFKMLGLADYLTDRIQGLRMKELAEYAQMRKFVTYRNTFSQIPPAFAPALTLTMFTLIKGGHALSPAVTFTTLALVTLVTSPIQEIIHAVPIFQIGLASLDRVQTFLLLESGREDAPTVQSHPRPANHDDNVLDLATLPPNGSDLVDMVVRLESASIVVGKEKKPVLRNVTITVRSRCLTLIVGPVGSGKSTLLKAIIGDLAIVNGCRQFAGETCEAAYCGQDPWLPNETVRDLIVAQSNFEQTWYAHVVEACALKLDIATLQLGDKTTIGTKGVLLSGGQRQRLALARAVYSRKPLLVVDDGLSGLDGNTSRHVFNQVFGPNGICKNYGIAAVLATHAVHYLPHSDHIVILEEDGTIKQQGSFSELQFSLEYAGSVATIVGEPNEIHPPESAVAAVKTGEHDQIEIAQQDLARRTGDIAVYLYYAKSIGWKYGIILISTAIISAFGMQFPSLWVLRWSDTESANKNKYPLGFWIGISVLLAMIAVVAKFIHIWVMLVDTVPQSSAQLHKQLLYTVMHAPYSFFVTTDSGTTLNRFSNDMSSIELELAGAVIMTLCNACMCIGGAMLIAVGSEYMAVTIPFIILVLYGVQRFYLRTSRQLRFIELEAQAPLITHISETLAGITTIRAFGWQDQSHQKCLKLLNRSQQPFYLMLCIQRWLNLVLDLIIAAMAIVVVALAAMLRGNSSAGSIGVSLLNILSFNAYLSVLITAWTALETSLGAVARCKMFEENTPCEDRSGEDCEPRQDWPQYGEIEFRDVAASYTHHANKVLSGISFTVTAGEKVGICGRSGSGKSSLLLTLTRTLDLSSGTILIDNVDIATVPRRTLRSRLAVLPQEAITMPGSLRENLDPLGSSTESALRVALRKVGLLDTIENDGGIDIPMSKFSLSQGQMQLFATARALLCKSKVLMLDEVTSSVDEATEQSMMRTIFEEFGSRTVIAIAHRLESIIDFDQVIVVDGGKIVEVGVPRALLKQNESWFKSLWKRAEH